MSLCQAYGTLFRGRYGDYGTYFVLYDPFTCRRLSQGGYERKLSQGRPQVPQDHPTRYACDEVIEEGGVGGVDWHLLQSRSIA